MHASWSNFLFPSADVSCDENEKSDFRMSESSLENPAGKRAARCTRDEREREENEDSASQTPVIKRRSPIESPNEITLNHKRNRQRSYVTYAIRIVNFVTLLKMARFLIRLWMEQQFWEIFQEYKLKKTIIFFWLWFDERQTLMQRKDVDVRMSDERDLRTSESIDHHQSQFTFFSGNERASSSNEADTRTRFTFPPVNKPRFREWANAF